MAGELGDDDPPLFQGALRYTGDVLVTSGTNVTRLTSGVIRRLAVSVPPGVDGSDGADGAPGAPGPTGPVGAPGLTGSPGPPGSDGADGSEGFPGPQGTTGQTGATGAAGAAGAAGPPGADGDQGATGEPGPAGATGATGSTGAAGATGPAGPPGNDGEDGRDGAPGAPGAAVAGPQGPQGTPGPPGAQGEDGAEGAVGPPGPTGPTGATGARGLQGPPGPDGLDGLDGEQGPPGPGLTDGNKVDVTVSGSGTSMVINANAVTNAKAADMPANTVKANPTAGAADPQDVAIAADSSLARVGGNLVSHPFSTLAGGGLAYAAGVMAVGAGTGITVNANDVAVAADAAKHGVVDASGVGFRKSRRRNFWYEEFDQFEYSVLGASTVITNESVRSFGTTSWWLQAGGLSGSIAQIAAGASHPGVIRLETGSTSGNFLYLYRGVGNNPGFLGYSGQDIFSVEAVLRLATSQTGIFVQFGVVDGLGSNNGAYFLFDSASDSTVHTRTAEAGATTDGDTNTAPGGGWNTYTILQETLGTFDFYMDDVLETTSSTNTPDTEAVNVLLLVQTSTNAAKNMDIDYVSLETRDLGDRTS